MIARQCPQPHKGEGDGDMKLFDKSGDFLTRASRNDTAADDGKRTLSVYNLFRRFCCANTKICIGFVGLLDRK